MADLLRHRQTKGAATVMVDLRPPRHTSTLPTTANHHEAGEQSLERGAARFSAPVWIPRSPVPTGYYVSTANRRFPEP